MSTAIVYKGAESRSLTHCLRLAFVSTASSLFVSKTHTHPLASRATTAVEAYEGSTNPPAEARSKKLVSNSTNSSLEKLSAAFLICMHASFERGCARAGPSSIENPSVSTTSAYCTPGTVRTRLSASRRTRSAACVNVLCTTDMYEEVDGAITTWGGRSLSTPSAKSSNAAPTPVSSLTTCGNEDVCTPSRFSAYAA